MKHIVIGLVMAMMTLGIGCAAFAADAFGDMYAGTAKVDITPAEENAVDLVGKKLKIRDHLYARVLVLKSGDTSVAIVSLDLILFSSAKVVAEAKQKWGVDHVILCSTHTHAGMAPKGLILKPHSRNDWTRAGDPGDMVDWPALSEDPWYAATEAKIVAAIGEAVKNLFPATVQAARGPYENPYMAHNRRRVNPDGSVSAMWDNPNRLPTEPIDPTLGIIRVTDAAGKPRVLLVNYACHPVASANSGYLYRDFPGEMVNYVEENLGDDCMAMFTQGAEGDQDPYDMAHGEHGFNIIKYAGISLGKRALALAETLDKKPAALRPSIRVKESSLDIRCRRRDNVSTVVITTIVLNESMALVSVPGEPFVQHQIDLRASSPLAETFMLGLAYSGAGTPFAVYIPTAQAVKEGGYGATECSFLEPRAGEIIVSEASASIKELLSK